MRKLLKTLTKPSLLLPALGQRGFFRWLPDRPYLKMMYKAKLGRHVNLENPQTFNEKLQWLKLNDRNPAYVPWVDKLEAKNKAAHIIGKAHVVPLLGAWENPEDIPFDTLPDIFILKCNHDQGSVKCVRKNQGFDSAGLIRFYQKRLQKNPFPNTREWPYTQIRPMVFAEAYLGENLPDYKIFCFNGKPAFINIGIVDLHTHETQVTFLDFKWQEMPFQRSDFKRVAQLPPKPEDLNRMLSLAQTLAQGTAFVRIDFFKSDKALYFSEYTLYPTSGYIKFMPSESDLMLGSRMDLGKFPAGKGKIP